MVMTIESVAVLVYIFYRLQLLIG